MPGLLMHSLATMQCFHQSPAVTAPTQTRVIVSGQLVATSLNQILVPPLCPFQIPIGTGTKPQPCVRIQWSNLSTRFLVMGQPVLLQPSPGPGSGLCLSVEGIPQGVPTISVLQTRVIGS